MVSPQLPFRFSLFQCGLAQLPAAPPNSISQHAVQLVAPPTSGLAVRTHLLQRYLIFLHIYRLSSTIGSIETPSLSGLKGVASIPETPLSQPIPQKENEAGGEQNIPLVSAPQLVQSPGGAPFGKRWSLASSSPVSFVPAPPTLEALPIIISVFIRLHPGI